MAAFASPFGKCFGIAVTNPKRKRSNSMKNTPTKTVYALIMTNRFTGATMIAATYTTSYKALQAKCLQESDPISFRFHVEEMKIPKQCGSVIA